MARYRGTNTQEADSGISQRQLGEASVPIAGLSAIQQPNLEVTARGMGEILVNMVS